ncbi:MAG TPA: hypothetical protein VIK79_01830 [Xanthobacteraceae bacterium]|jgi:hypothetical protein
MSPGAHLKKAERIERSLGRLTERDYEMRIDGAMLAATHYANMALHVLGLTVSERDIIHTEFLQVIDYKRLRVAARALLEALEDIEALRAPYVRGAHADGQAAGARALQLLQVVRSEAKRVAPIPFPIVNYVPKPAE